jgi:hypothetical protein
MEKLNKGIVVVFEKVQTILNGTINTVSQAFIVSLSSTLEVLFATGGEVTKNISVLLGVLNDNIARIKNLLDGEPK